MQQFKLYLKFISFSVFILPAIAWAQESKNGYQLPPKGTVKVLIVFAEIVGCGGSPSPGWPTGPAAPPNADKYIDYAISTNPTTFLTRYYRDISLGDYNLIGDYYDGTVQVPCSLFTQYGNSSAIIQLNSTWQATGGYYLTKHGLNLNSFDDYQFLSPGTFKPSGNPDGNIDATIILWRNHPVYSCSEGLGVGNLISTPLKNKSVYLYGSWGYCPDNLITSYDGFFVAEYFHSIFGSNNFHTGGGASPGPFMFRGTASYTTTAQEFSASNIVCGWDRNFLGWKGSRQYQIGALNQLGQEIPSDINVITNPNTSYFVLRDFVTIGDAIRIKLPHFNWQQNGDKKNQYLWIENHQLVNEFDKNKSYNTCAKWLPGLYCYVQAGKDVISGSSTNIYAYTGNPANPNELKDWLFPLSAEGRWDFFYSSSDKNLNPNVCVWNNYSMPYSTYFPDGSRKQNPFTGYSDAFGYIDSDNNGIINWVQNGTDSWQPRYQKWLGTPVIGSPPSPRIPWWGDELDAFTSVNQKLSISTNPSPVPVYTLTEGATIPGSYDNRSIHLNNLSIEILNNNFYNVLKAPKAFLISVKWNDKNIDNDVRWCGNVVLANDPQDTLQRAMQIRVITNKTITIDKGLSPTYPNELTTGSRNFTDNSFFHLLNGTTTTLDSSSLINIINSSTFHAQSGSTLNIGPNSQIVIDPTSFICIEDGANVVFQNSNTSKIVINNLTYKWTHSIQNTILSAASSDYYSLNSITTSGTQSGVSMPSSGNVVLQARTSIIISPNTSIIVQPGQTFTAKIYTPYNCNNANNYNTRYNSDNPVSISNYIDPEATLAQPAIATVKNINAAIQLTDIMLYPNPVKDKLVLYFGKLNYKKISISIINDQGKNILTIRNLNSNSTSQTTEINTSKFANGLYFIRITGDKISITKKFEKH